MSERVTVLVFKDNFAARTFQVPLNWISRFGLLLGILAFTAVASGLIAIKYYRMSSGANPARVQALELELAKLHATHQELQTASKSALPPAGAPASQPAAAQTTVPSANVNSLTGDLLFPGGSAVPDPSTLPFTVSEPRTRWQGGTLHANFNLNYTHPEGGSQQGRIIVLARGASTLLAYPDGVLNRPGSDTLIAPERGEYFSVSRFREVKADFSGIRSKDSIHDVELLLFNTQGHLIFRQAVPTEGAPQTSLPGPVRAQQPETTESKPAPKARHSRAQPVAPQADEPETAAPAHAGSADGAPATNPAPAPTPAPSTSPANGGIYQ